MHEIKFRGKRVDNGEWVVGFYVGDFCFEDEGRILSIDETGMGIECEVDPATVGQFIRRKDKNKKEIYSGDIVICNYGRWHEEPRGLTRIGIVEYSDVHCGFVIRVLNSKVKVSFPDVTKSTVEIIGNVTDNPKLLEVQP